MTNGTCAFDVNNANIVDYSGCIGNDEGLGDGDQIELDLLCEEELVCAMTQNRRNQHTFDSGHHDSEQRSVGGVGEAGTVDRKSVV